MQTSTFQFILHSHLAEEEVIRVGPREGDDSLTEPLRTRGLRVFSMTHIKP